MFLIHFLLTGRSGSPGKTLNPRISICELQTVTGRIGINGTAGRERGQKKRVSRLLAQKHAQTQNKQTTTK